MNTTEIDDYMEKDPYIRRYYGGTLAKDQLPIYVTNGPKIYVLNLQNSNQPGNHWITMWMDKIPEYFDSLGEGPIEEFQNYLIVHGPKFKFNFKRLQNYGSDVCAKYCIFYSYLKCRGYTFKDIMELFSNDLLLNDVKAEYFYDVTV